MDVRKDPKHFPHQTDAERRADLDIADEGEGIPKVPGYIPHDDPKATPDLNLTKCALLLCYAHLSSHKEHHGPPTMR